MKIRAKLVLSFGSVLLFSLVLVGFVALALSRTNSLNTISNNLNSAVTAVNSYDDSPITAGLSVALEADFPLAAGLLTSDRELTVFTESPINVDQVSIGIAERAIDNSVEIGTNSKYLIRSIPLGDGSFVILASDLSSLEKSQTELRNQVTGVILLIMMLSLSVALLSLRKEIFAIRKLSREADAISSGNFELQFTEIAGESEVGSLSRSLSSMAKSLQGQNLEMKRLLGDISHELKTPLTSIKGYAELLNLKANESIKDSNALNILLTEVNHMAKLVDDILLMSKLGAITYELTDSVNLGQLVEQRFRILQELQPERKVTFIDECNQDITGSESLIVRMLDNLVANALVHTQSTDAIVVTTVTDIDSWTIQYEDAGAGMPENFQELPETNFSRFDSRASLGKGSGLGLSIIEGIASQHGGTVTIGKSYLGGMLLRVTAPTK